MQIGLGMCGLSSASFWALSLAEWQCLLDGFLEFNGQAPGAANAMNRAELREMMEMYPDG